MPPSLPVPPTVPPAFWVAFGLLVVAILALDLGVINRKSHVVGMREALRWSAVWISLALIFCAVLFFAYSKVAAMEFITGYLIEYSLSIDNIFVFVLIFNYFHVPPKYQHKVLFWGIIGALALRLIFIVAGISLIARFEWLIYVFGGFLVFSGIKMLMRKDEPMDPEKNPVLRLIRRCMPLTPDFVGDRFMVKENGKRLATPLFAALVMVEASDVIFAVDSVPAILAITRDPFVVYTSNVFAILGLRSLYFALAGLMDLFHHLHYGLSAILVFVGGKMLTSSIYHMPGVMSLGIILTILLVSIVVSLRWPKHEGHGGHTPLAG